MKKIKLKKKLIGKKHNSLNSVIHNHIPPQKKKHIFFQVYCIMSHSKKVISV
jgi:hypothetical protein